MFEDPLELLRQYTEARVPAPQERCPPSLVSKVEAARLLDVAPRTIQNYRGRGYLCTAPGGLRGGVLAEDVRRLGAEGIPRRRPSDGLRECLLADRITHVEIRSRVIAEILDVRRQSLEVDNEEMAALADGAATAALHGWETGSERWWVELFLRLDDRHARRLARLRPGRNPWLPFLGLAEAISFALTTQGGHHGDAQAEAPVLPALARHAAERLQGEFAAWAEKKGATRSLRALLAEFEATRTTGTLTRD
jgi:hypothetical protein